jgi:predicted phosphodiesterase
MVHETDMICASANGVSFIVRVPSHLNNNQFRMKIAIISDIHEDYMSLMKAARIILKQGCNEVICLGDIVGFSVPYYHYFETRDASACVKWVKEHCKYVVAGNHDLYAIKQLPRNEVRGFRFPPDWYGMPFHQRVEMARDQLWLYEDHELSALLDIQGQEFLKGLPEQLVIEADGTSCLLSHFIAPDITGSAKAFLVGFEDIQSHHLLMNACGCSLSFSGHMHANGMVKSSNVQIDYLGFGKEVPLNGLHWIGAPAIARSRKTNGFLIWDSEKRTIQTVSLKSKFSIR